MKARQITTTDRHGEKTTHVFRNYADALSRRMYQRTENLWSWHSENRFWKSMLAKKLSRITEIDVADDYRKKDFWTWISVRTAKWWRNPHEVKTTEEEYLYWTLYWLYHELLGWQDPDVKFMLRDLKRFLETPLPKKERNEQARECFLFCRNTLRKMWADYLIDEHTRWMYEEDLNDYCERMWAMQNELNSML